MLHRSWSSVLLGVYSLLCVGFLALHPDPLVQSLRHAFLYCLHPASDLLAGPWDHSQRWAGRVWQLLYTDQKRRTLEDEVQHLRLKSVEWESERAENIRLKKILNLPLPVSRRRVVAQVEKRDSSDWFRSVTVNRGQREGLAVQDPAAMVVEGRWVVVGQVVEVWDNGSRVLLITDGLSNISCRLARTGELGSLEGQGGGDLLLNYLLSDSDARPGDEVVTAGLGGVFPEGLVVGTIRSIEDSPLRSFHQAMVRPRAQFSFLSEVVLFPRTKDGQGSPQ